MYSTTYLADVNTTQSGEKARENFKNGMKLHWLEGVSAGAVHNVRREASD